MQNCSAHCSTGDRGDNFSYLGFREITQLVLFLRVSEALDFYLVQSVFSSLLTFT